MDFSFSQEQEMLRSQARSFLDQRMPAERVVELAEGDSPWDESLWTEMAGLGWTSLSIPEDSGGSGMTFLDEAVLFEELGYALYPGPYFSTVALALPALADSPDVLGRIASGDAAVTLAWAEPGRTVPLDDVAGVSVGAERSGDSWTLEGTKDLVPDVGIATAAVVVAADGGDAGFWLVELDAQGVTVEAASTMDSTRRLGTLRLERAPAELLAPPGSAVSVLRAIRLRAGAAAALESVGIAQKALDLAIDHAKTRHQFDKPIGSYQAVSHQITDTYVDLELARSLAYWAAWSVAEHDEQAAAAVPAAKAAAGRAAVTACERSIQVHGGIGFTWEHILHRYYKRAQWLDAFDGFGRAQRAEVARILLDS